MAFMYPDRIRETSTTKGTGAITLAGAPTGWRTFSSGLSAADTFPYVIEGRDASGNQTDEWETGIGTFTAGALARTTVTNSSNSGNAVNFASASLVCYIGLNRDGLEDVADISAASAVYAHTQAADPHTGYLLSSAASAAQYHPTRTDNPHATTAAQVGADATGTATSAVFAHTQVADPHTGYILESREGQASGVATLNAQAIVTQAQSGFPLLQMVQRGDGFTYGIPSHALITGNGGPTTRTVLANYYRATPFVCSADVRVTEFVCGVQTGGTAGSLGQIAVYNVTTSTTGFPIASTLLYHAGTVAIDSTGKKTITGASLPLYRGNLYAIGISVSANVTLYANRYSCAGQMIWQGDNLAAQGTDLEIASMYPPPASPNTQFTEANYNALEHYSVVGAKWVAQ